MKALTTLQFMLGFFKYQIEQVVENMEAIFSFSDVYKFVEIWYKRHAMEILSVINDVFNDGNTESQSTESTSLSQLENSFQHNENASSDSQEMGVPSAVLVTVEAIHPNDQF